jgi:hypothetical protein
VDYFREYGDSADLYTEVQKLEVYDEMQSYIEQRGSMLMKPLSGFTTSRTGYDP